MHCNKIAVYNREDLLQVILSWRKMIDRNGEKWPTATLSDLKSSMQCILEKEGVIDDYE